MEQKFSKDELLEMIHSGLTKLTREEIIGFIDEELKKENSQIDMDYIDLCYELLEVISSNNKVKKKKLSKVSKFLLIAAQFVIVIFSTLTVSAQVFHIDIPQKIVAFINGNADIDYHLDGVNTVATEYTLLETHLAKEVESYGITPITFPKEMTKEDCEILSIEDVPSNGITHLINIEFEYKNKKGDLYIEETLKGAQVTGIKSVTEVDSGQMILVNGMDILVFKQENNCAIQYQDGLIRYDIFLECNLKTAIQFANSIK